ncbi:MAG: hypothetical protein P4L90_10125 [Rhodopila sp.]|nr:hypothetical protein [Rhodopila sp.]
MKRFIGMAIMHMRTGVPLLAFCVAACATLPPTEQTPYLPAGVYGVYQDNDVGAINQSAWAFASSANTAGNPVAAAKAVIALEYLSGELRENPRWVGMDQSVKLRMGQARDQLRQILGIHPDAPPQFVVNVLLALAWDLETGNQPAAMQMLAAPVFIQPPVRTLQILSNLPYVQTANLATSRAESQSFASDGPRG